MKRLTSCEYSTVYFCSIGTRADDYSVYIASHLISLTVPVVRDEKPPFRVIDADAPLSLVQVLEESLALTLT